MSYQVSCNDSDVSEARREILEAYARGIDDSDAKDKDTRRAEVDRYGFVCKSPCVPLTKEEVDKECVLQAKWLKILNKWDKVFPSAKIRKLIFKGLPNSLRGEVWKRVLETQKSISANENKYENMRYQAFKTSNDVKQIDLDINRTYRDHVMFMQRYGLKQRSLFNVLVAYTVHNSEVGYCQGMSSVAALLLMYMGEEDAFWGLSTLLTGQKHTMHGFFINGFPKLMRFQTHHAKILRKMLPSLSDHFEQQGILSSLYTLKWYMQCFLDRLPFYLILRLWDVFILEGDKILHPIGYTLLKIHKKRLMKMSMDELAQFLSAGMQDVKYVGDSFMDALLDNIDELKKNNLYPAPSVVKGELPGESNLTTKLDGDYHHGSFKRNSLMTNIDNDLETLSNVSYAENELIDDLTASRFKSANVNVRYPGLDPAIPLPPSTHAPIPSSLSFVDNNGRLSLISENIYQSNRDGELTTQDSYYDSRSSSCNFSKIVDNEIKPATSASSEMVARRMENIKVVHSMIEPVEVNLSDVDDGEDST